MNRASSKRLHYVLPRYPPISLSRSLHFAKGSAWTEAWNVCLSAERAMTPELIDLLAIRLQIYIIFIYTILFAWFFWKIFIERAWIHRDFGFIGGGVFEREISHRFHGWHRFYLWPRIEQIERMPCGVWEERKKHEKHPMDMEAFFESWRSEVPIVSLWASSHCQ